VFISKHKYASQTQHENLLFWQDAYPFTYVVVSEYMTCFHSSFGVKKIFLYLYTMGILMHHFKVGLRKEDLILKGQFKKKKSEEQLPWVLWEANREARMSPELMN
jgi:hypothetical protein